jgi:hypothetical protein
MAPPPLVGREAPVIGFDVQRLELELLEPALADANVARLCAGNALRAVLAGAASSDAGRERAAALRVALDSACTKVLEDADDGDAKAAAAAQAAQLVVSSVPSSGNALGHSVYLAHAAAALAHAPLPVYAGRIINGFTPERAAASSLVRGSQPGIVIKGLRRGAAYLAANASLVPLLGIWQNLLATKNQEDHAFALLDARGRDDGVGVRDHARDAGDVDALPRGR